MSYIGNIPTTVAFLVDTFSGNGSTTAFTLSQAPANTSSILVAVSGVVQDPSTYSVSGTTLTFSGAPPSGSSNISVRFLGIPASGIATTAYRTVTEFTATAGQTTFSVPSYTPGYIDVYRNGVMLGSADYTATNGTTVVLASGATAGDLVETISFYVSSVLNAIPAVANAVTDAYINTGAVTQTKVATGVAGTGPAFSAQITTTQTITANVNTKVVFGTEYFDTNSNYDASTGRFTPTIAGYYQLNAQIYFPANSSSYATSELQKNGSAIAVAATASQTYVAACPSISSVIYLNGSTDYVEVYAATGQSGTLNLTSSSRFSGALVRAA